MIQSKRTLVFATNNAHKLEEMRKIVGEAVDVVSLKELGCEEDIPENEATLEGNAVSKSRWIYRKYGKNCFADDTGLEVEALNGEPGVRSARYAPGDGHDSAANMKLLLKNLEGVENRRARFRTVISLIVDGEEYVFEGVVNGRIATAPSGLGGFGYDPVFIPDGDTRSFAEYTAEEKNAISHRGRAGNALLGFLLNKKNEEKENQ